MKFTKEFKSNLEAIHQKLEEARALLPSLQLTEVDLDKAGAITLKDIEDSAVLTNRLKSLTDAITDVSNGLSNFISQVTTTP